MVIRISKNTFVSANKFNISANQAIERRLDFPNIFEVDTMICFTWSYSLWN